jgi:S-adenosylmethionine:tRNA ribosyltransferase-isomerase
MDVSLFDYVLPRELIAQHPERERDRSRMMVLDRASGRLEHHVTADLPEILGKGDLLVANDTKVFPARLFGRRSTGGVVEALFLGERGGGLWEALLKARGRLKTGEVLSFGAGELEGTLEARPGPGRWLVRFSPHVPVWDRLEHLGRVPLPPYIKRDRKGDRRDREDRERYQTIFAEKRGAVAAPTAGLHFTEDLIARLVRAGVEVRALTLHVGIGTFLPVRTDRVEAHTMHGERYEIPGETHDALRRARSAGRVVAVGTTTVRALEAFARSGIARGETDLFIYPPFEFRLVQALLTNFHLPKSTLLMLVAAFVGRERILDAYRVAVEKRYRFYSYGDAMLIL